MSFLRHPLAAAALALSLAVLPVFAQQQEDDDKYVRLMSAQSVRLLEKDGKPFRKAEGPARFLHNNTWLICDTALWDVDSQIIYAMGNVSIEQENTELLGDNLTYYVERDLAEFRGSLVQLRDADGNTLRTTNLDYNTKDSVAVFRDGGALRDHDGQIIESDEGTYDSRIRTFTFERNVDMFTDSVFVKTSRLIYASPTSLATFPFMVEAWKDDKSLSANRGSYDRENEIFFFTGNVHGMSKDQESWCDTLRYERSAGNLELLSNAQITDTTRSVTSMGGRMYYVDSLSRLYVQRDPFVVMHKDSTYFRADSIVYTGVPRCSITEATLKDVSTRLDGLQVDPVTNIRRKAAEEAAKKQQEAIDNDPNSDPTLRSDYKQKKAAEEAALKSSADSLAAANAPSVPADTTALAAADSTAVAPIDSSKVGFVSAKGSVKMFRPDMQSLCDSLEYCDLDSLARMFGNPVIWNEKGRHQYNSDSLYIAVRNSRMTRANLFSNAFIQVDEDGVHYDQIRSTEMTAFFDDSTHLERFDALGTASAILFLREKDRISTVNKKESTMLSADFVNGEISRITYFESPKSSAYPLAQIAPSELVLKGFSWRASERPVKPSDLSRRIVRSTERKLYSGRKRPSFLRTEKYFKGYMAQVYREIERSDSLRRAARLATAAEDTLSSRRTDSLGVVLTAADSLAVSDSLATADSLSARDSLAITRDSLAVGDSLTVRDSLAVGTDSLAVKDSLSAKQRLRLEKEKAREAAAAKRQKEREEKWRLMDERDAQKQAEKEARLAEKKRRREQILYERLLKQKAEEDALREKYKQNYLKKYSK